MHAYLAWPTRRGPPSAQGKQPLIDLVHSLSLNPRAFEPAFSAVAAQIDELGQLVAWHFNSAVRRLPTPDSLRAALGRWSAGNAEAQLAPPKSVPDLTELEQAWLTLKVRRAVVVAAIVVVQGR